MSTSVAISRGRIVAGPLLVAAVLAALAAVLVRTSGTGLEATYVVFIVVAGLAMGSLALLMIGHLMNEGWLAPVRSEAEAAALTMPLLFLMGIPLALGLEQLFPWADNGIDLPSGRTVFLSPAFFLVRSVVYILIASVIAFWLAGTGNPRRVSGIGLFLLTPVITFAAFDWAFSRDPTWWSSLFGFAFALSQVLAALALTILITLLRPEHAAPERMRSLERALLTLSLLAIWTWFGHFLIVWLANLPDEAAWYLRRADPGNLVLIGIAFAAMILAVLILIPTGVSRRVMIVGSVLVLVQHGVHMVWLLQPVRRLSWLDLGLALAAAAIWIVAFAILIRSRPTYAEEMAEEP
ncbi:hypothetical protein [Microvirga lenta]|uniref:hypothetical protein n=1 Tax=Microvirga lenta TaxID=2881337 RepID=UPI001CFFFFCD|nr:hypothetical protein [Microvirga lenta]MCB5175722.1 hypothetical protein [Microvirga lenta]